MENIKSLNEISDFVQYKHVAVGYKIPCVDCLLKHNRIYDNNFRKPLVGEENHPKCHCCYIDIEIKQDRYNIKNGV